MVYHENDSMVQAVRSRWGDGMTWWIRMVVKWDAIEGGEEFAFLMRRRSKLVFD
jgi:hypothetical protein